MADRDMTTTVSIVMKIVDCASKMFGQFDASASALVNENRLKTC